MISARGFVTLAISTAVHGGSKALLTSSSLSSITMLMSLTFGQHSADIPLSERGTQTILPIATIYPVITCHKTTSLAW